MDLISRKAVVEYLMTNVVWHDEDGYEVDDADEKRTHIEDLINGVPSVPAMPMEMISKKLGSLCKPCIFQTIGCPYKSFDCDSCNTSDAWEKTIIKWMEEQDAD